MSSLLTMPLSMLPIRLKGNWEHFSGNSFRPLGAQKKDISVVVNFLSQVIFLFLLFLGMVMTVC